MKQLKEFKVDLKALRKAQFSKLKKRDHVEDVRIPDLNPNNPVVFLEFTGGGEYVGRIECELFKDVVPRTAENFRCLCTGERGVGKKAPLTFKGSPLHRIIPGFMAQGGDITHGDGTGGESIYGRVFRDEKFHYRHTERGLLSMANAGRNTNSSQFFITFDAQSHLDGKHVIFGKVRKGNDIIDRLEDLGHHTGKPQERVLISDCGEVRLKKRSRSSEQEVEARARKAFMTDRCIVEELVEVDVAEEYAAPPPGI